MAGSGDRLKRTIESGAYRKVGNKFHFIGGLFNSNWNSTRALSINL